MVHCVHTVLLFLTVTVKQGQTVHKLQIAAFWDIYLYKERDIIKYCVCKMCNCCP